MVFIMPVLLLVFSLLNPGLISANSIVINEIMPHPSPGVDWVELYNPTTVVIDLTNWKLYDSTSLVKTLSGSISSKGFMSFDVNNRLTNAGDTIILKDPNGLLVDSYSYIIDPGINKPLGRSPDGGTWNVLESSSKNQSNLVFIDPSAPLPNPTQNPSPSYTPSPTPTAVFQIYEMPKNINSNNEIEVDINLIGLIKDTSYFLKGAFSKQDSTNYFGKTFVSGNWVKNNSSYSSQLSITTDSSGNWNGKIKVMPDESDKGFSGSGEYNFKVARYNQDGSHLTWSNTQSVIIGKQPTPTTPSQPTNQSSIDTDIKPPVQKTLNKSITRNIPDLSSSQTAAVAGASKSINPSPSPRSTVKNNRVLNYSAVITGSIGLLGSIGWIVYNYRRRVTRNDF